jgi:methionyl-tRNA formyltransferase
MGTPDFAVASLRALVDGGYNVSGVVTTPDRPIGKHQSVLSECPVKKYAREKGIFTLQPEKLKDTVFLNQLAELKADLQIVVAFRMLPEAVWAMPRLGTFNLHASLLPQYRGAAPINRAIMAGDTETGVTTFFLTHEIDCGKIILRRSIPINDTDDAGVIHDRLMALGSELVIETVDLIGSGRVGGVLQETLYDAATELRPAPKLFTENCRINWQMPMKHIYDFIRGLSPYPAAWTELISSNGERRVVKIYQTEKIPAEHFLPSGTLITSSRDTIDAAVNGGFIRLLSLQMAGRKRMKAIDFLNGFRLEEGSRLA